MKAYGINIAEGSNVSNLTVASGTSFPSNPNDAELFYRTDSDVRVRGLYVYVSGTWDRIASADSVTVPSGTSFPSVANAGDLFYKNSNDGLEGLYAYNDTSWVAVSAGGISFTITGDVTGTIDGAPDVLTLATVNSNVGSFGNNSSYTQFTVNGKGLVTAASSGQINIDTSQVVSGTFANARIAQSNVTQYQANLALAASQITSGTFADARIAQTNVTQYQSNLSIAETQIPNGSLLARVADNETISGNWIVNGNWTFNTAITGTDPTSASHLTTKQYVDNALNGLSWKHPVRVATTANITLSGTQTIDGIAVIAGDRVLVKNQTTQSNNGVYVVASGAWTRATDFDSISPIDEINSAAVFVAVGTTQADTGWTQTAEVTTVGTDNIVFVQFSAAGAYVGGAGLTLTGNTFDVGTASSSRIVVNVDNIDLATIGTPVTASFVKPTTDAYGRVSATTPVVVGDITALLSYTGDVSTSGTTATLATVNANVGTFNTLTVNAKGLVTSASNTSYQPLDADLTAIAAFASTGFAVRTATDTWAQRSFTSTGSTITITNPAGIAGNVNLDLPAVGTPVSASFVKITTDTQGRVSATTAVVAADITGLVDSVYVNVTGDTMTGPLRMDASTQVTANGTAGSLMLGYANSAITSTTDAFVTWAGSAQPLISAFGGANGSLLLAARNVSGGAIVLSTGNANRAMIDFAGNFGVNTTSPSTFGLFSVVSASNRFIALTPNVGASISRFRYDDNSAPQIQFTNLAMTAANQGVVLNWGLGSDNVTEIAAGRIGALAENTWTATASTQNSYMQFATVASGTLSERMRINSAGNLGIGTTNPTFQFDLQGTGGAPMALTRYLNGASSTSISLLHSRGATVGTNTIVQSGDIFGSIIFGGANGTGYDSGAMIRAEVDGTPGASNDMPGRMLFHTTPDNSATLTERMRIDSSGFVSVGTTGETTYSKGLVSDLGIAKSQTWTTMSLKSYTGAVQNGAGLIVLGKSRSATVGTFVATTTDDVLGYIAAEGVNSSSAARWAAAINFAQDGTAGATFLPGRIVFMTGTNAVDVVERMRIDSVGNVGIGVTPSTRLHVAGTLTINSAGGTFFSIGGNVDAANYGTFKTSAGAALGYIGGGAGAAISGGTASDFVVRGAAANLILSAAGGTNDFTINSSGTIGVGVTPSAWGAGQKAIDVGPYAAFRGDSLSTSMENNVYFNGTNFIAKNTNASTEFSMNNGIMYWYNAASVTNGSTVTFSERMRLDINGRLGIGRNNPGYKLEVQDAQTGAYSTSALGTPEARFINVHNAGGANQYASIHLQATGDNETNNAVVELSCVQVTAATSTGDFTVKTRLAGVATERIRVTSGGKLLIGTTGVDPSGSRTLGTAIDSAGGINLYAASAVSVYGLNVTSGTHITFYSDNGSTRVTGGSISTNGSTTAFNTTSDVRLKKNIVDAGSAGAKIDSIQVRTFDFIEGDQHVEHGFVAQELVQVAPEAVTVGDGEQVWGVDPSKLVALLLKEIQELRARVAALEAK